jgi:hypothetical protein
MTFATTSNFARFNLNTGKICKSLKDTLPPKYLVYNTTHYEFVNSSKDFLVIAFHPKLITSHEESGEIAEFVRMTWTFSSCVY